jgi:hypothetical protein
MRAKQYFFLLLIFAPFALLNWDCKKSSAAGEHSYKTKNVIIVVVDGPRYTETWGLPSRALIPNRAALLSEGVLCDNFYNKGYTFTNAGHTAICTGNYQFIDNGGGQYPSYPSFFQYWLKKNGNSSDKAWVITTKDKLEILSDCTDNTWAGQYRPKTDCGNAGLGTGYRIDSITFYRASSVLSSSHPNLMLINFKEPDASGHANDSAGYVQGIIDTDLYIKRIWDQIQNDTYYKDQTTLIVTNDHGRHTAGHLDGFRSHTDYCEGCKHIEFFALGPDFKKNYVSTKPYSQIDIASTVAELLELGMPTSKGKVMRDIIKL